MASIKELFSLREGLALLATVFVPAIVLSSPAILFGNSKEGFWVLRFVIGYSMTMAVPIAFLIVLFLNWRRLTRLGHYVAAGSVLALWLYLTLAFPALRDGGMAGLAAGFEAYFGQFLVLLILSILGAMLYWTMARPDKIH